MIDIFLFYQRFININTIYLNNNFIHYIDFNLFSLLPKLKYIYIYNNFINKNLYNEYALRSNNHNIKIFVIPSSLK